jgi:8-oxo-dGTP diphosphatase
MSVHPSKQNIKVAVDAVIFTVRENQLQVLLIKMKKEPYAGRWAFPGGLLEENETAADALRRILKDSTGVTKGYLEQLKTFDDPKRDSFGRVVSVAHFALISSEDTSLRTTEKYADVRWWPVAKLPPLAYDHDQIAAHAVMRLRARLGYTNVAWGVLPPSFTFAELQAVYEAVLGEPLDKRNFRKKILASDLLKSTGKQSKGGAHRPAELYRFAKSGSVPVNLLD